MEEEKIVLICKALSDPNRLHIVQYLTHGELCACNLLERLQITQPTLSHHMKALCEAGLIQGRKEGKWMHYALDCATLREFRAVIDALHCCDASNKNDQCSC
jgi:ArsR family transcriptional regulator, arsenate/arsenite/antimonite-responsive transcriptional repressor